MMLVLKEDCFQDSGNNVGRGGLPPAGLGITLVDENTVRAFDFEQQQLQTNTPHSLKKLWRVVPLTMAAVEQARQAMAANYKALKEDFVSNLSGGSILEINIVTAVAPVSC